MAEKVCFKCSILKPLSDFYKHKRMGDGHLNKCKECTKKDVYEHRTVNIEKIREYDRNRPNRQERAHKQKDYARTDKGREVITKSRDKYRKKHKVRKEAVYTLSNALRDGKIFRPTSCSKCGVSCTPHGHHNDYTKPLDVVWVCVSCHTEFHKCVRKLERDYEREFGVKVKDNSEMILEVAEWFWK